MGVDILKLALRWRADGKDSTLTWITLTAAHSVFIGKFVVVGIGSILSPPPFLLNNLPRVIRSHPFRPSSELARSWTGARRRAFFILSYQFDVVHNRSRVQL